MLASDEAGEGTAQLCWRSLPNGMEVLELEGEVIGRIWAVRQIAPWFADARGAPCGRHATKDAARRSVEHDARSRPR
jgi:hypothetical protein